MRALCPCRPPTSSASSLTRDACATKDTSAPHYRKLIGLSLVKDFRKNVRDLLGGVRGCTHITEMLGGMPTAAIQTLAGEMQEHGEDGRKPFQLDQCHALETSSETVKKWYPKWYENPRVPR